MSVNLNTLAKGTYIVQVEFSGKPGYLERISGDLEQYITNQSKLRDKEDLFSVSSQVDFCLKQLRTASKSMHLDIKSPLF
jgi:hypothetical protein